MVQNCFFYSKSKFNRVYACAIRVKGQGRGLAFTVFYHYCLWFL